MRRCGAGKLFLEEPTKTSLIICLLREEETQRYGWGRKASSCMISPSVAPARRSPDCFPNGTGHCRGQAPDVGTFERSIVAR